MKLRLLLILCILLPLAGNAQNDLRQWRKGPLTWNDFKAKAPDSTEAEHSYIEFQLYIDETPEEHDGATFWMKTAKACMDRQRSWVDSLWRTPEELKYNQVIFDLAELYRRYMQVALDSGGTPDPGDYMIPLIADVNDFCSESNYGEDTAVVHLWYGHVRGQLADMAAEVAESHVQASQQAVNLDSYVADQRFAMSMGGGVMVPTGQLNRYFSTGGGFYGECEFGYGRQLLNFGLFIGGAKCRDSLWHYYDSGKDLWKGDDLTILDLKFDYGIAVIDSYRFRLSPFVGVGLLGYSAEVPTQDADETTFIGPQAFNWRAGVDFRYHFTADVTHHDNSCEVTQFSLFVKAYAEQVSYSKYIDKPQGWIYSLAIGLAFHETTRVLR